VIERPAERRPPLSPQLAMRVAILGGLAFLLFGIVLFRLWYLQVLSGDQYVQQANNNQVRDVTIQAPRGLIVDRNGSTVVDNRQAIVVQIVRQDLPASASARLGLYRRLGGVLQISPSKIQQMVDNPQNLSYANVTIKTDVGQPVLDYLAERQEQFPGVTWPPVYLRSYPFHDLAAQLLGNVGEINAPQLKLARFKGVKQGTVIGQAGVEWTYDHYLRGRDGAKRVQVDALGRPRGSLTTLQPLPGQQLKLSLDLGLQKEGETALRTGMGLAQANGNAGLAGSFVAINPNNGEVLAMGSYPSFDPNVFAKPIPVSTYNRLFGSVGGAPGAQFNRAIEGEYPTGSTFKPIAALGALSAGVITPFTTQGGGACVTIAREQFCNAGKTNYGDLSLTDALRVSEDTYFYEVGAAANSYGNVLQTEARKLGLGTPTGIDLPAEQSGVVPDRAYFDRLNRLYCSGGLHRSPFCPYIWTVGQNVQLATGQGDFLATPLQMAVAYSAIANGGTVVRPHLGLEVDDSQGRLIQSINPPPSRHIAIDASYRQVILDGLHAAASQPGGTSADVFAGWPQGRYPVYGKTGTAQRGGQDDQSWYVCYVPDGPRSIVVAVTIEKGGFGAQAAAPAARLMLSEWFHLPTKVVQGSSRTL
jgi:penicillin-binding protein 2